MDYEWIYERVAPYYSAAKKCEAWDRPGGAGENGADPAPVQDPVAAADAPGVRGECGVPMVSGLRAVGQAPHFATVSYAFCRRFPEELAVEIFEHILNKALNNHMVDSSMVIHRRDAHQGKRQQEEIPEGTGGKAARVYAKRLREEVNEERGAKLGKAAGGGRRMATAMVAEGQQNRWYRRPTRSVGCTTKERA